MDATSDWRLLLLLALIPVLREMLSYLRARHRARHLERLLGNAKPGVTIIAADGREGGFQLSVSDGRTDAYVIEPRDQPDDAGPGEEAA